MFSKKSNEEPTITVSIKVPLSMYKRIEFYINEIKKDLPGLNLSKRDALTQLIADGMTLRRRQLRKKSFSK